MQIKLTYHLVWVMHITHAKNYTKIWKYSQSTRTTFSGDDATILLWNNDIHLCM